ncbi:uncharacterized protein [Blastocystis hominis]|uniref:Uncharacterized protein n=1 Tax=Blastocystis hominis TaxID=12968 RepID=D8M9D4_BLAHO|nr:uncharacterized protein [Blastocystis hominis]CBK24673.2 unnamed protein product [Blastocystis hominis]|eukprot:XP_012898721.1 uncharacterized protein [Blastocystis hominis]
MLNGIENAYFNEFRRSEIVYSMRDIRDHLTTIRWYVEEGTKIHNDLHHKVEITNRVRYGKLIYIITAFQTIFLPLQTITAIYGMNFDVFPELHFEYSYYIFWVVSVMLALILGYFLFRSRV